MVLFIVLTLFGLMIIGTPISFSLGITATLALLKMGIPALLSLIPQRLYAGIDSFPLMAIPFFILASELMNRAGLTDGLIKFSKHLVGHLRGGLGQVNILASVFFAGITGAAVADTAAIGGILIPAMEKDGYGAAYSAAVTAASSVIGPIIPPSIIMVIYGSMMGVSIAALFAGGMIPGLLVALALMVYNHFISVKRGYSRADRRPTMKEFVKDIPPSLTALAMPAIILGGILFGVFTPTEAAAVAVVYAFVVALRRRALSAKDLVPMLGRTCSTVGMILLVMGAASILGWILAAEQVPTIVAEAILGLSSNRIVVLLLINAVLLITGMFMDIGVALIILAPILAPLAYSVGMNPVHFGIMMCVNLNIGLITPPLGACLFIACGVAKLKLEEVVKEIWPFIIAEVVALLLITFIPDLCLAIPRWMGLMG